MNFKKIVSPDNASATLLIRLAHDGFWEMMGTQPPSFPVNLIHLWTSGPHESVIRINLQNGTSVGIETFKERLRKAVNDQLPKVDISFEPGDLVEQVINLGSSNPVEVAITGRDLKQTRKLSEQLLSKLKGIDYLRDVQIATPFDYPGILIDIDRVKAAAWPFGR